MGGEHPLRTGGGSAADAHPAHGRTPLPAPGKRTLIESLPHAPPQQRKDRDGEILTEARRLEGVPQISLGPAGSKYKPEATRAESFDVTDEVNDRLRMTVTYRLEFRPRELQIIGGEQTDLWVVVEKQAQLVLGTGEVISAQITGSGIVQIAYDAPLDPVAATRLPSRAPHHLGRVYLPATEERVTVFGPGAPGTSLVQDAASVDLLAYGDPLRTIVALKRVLKDKRVAGKGAEVAKTHASVEKLLGKVTEVSAGLREHLQLVHSYRDGQPGEIWYAGEVLHEVADTLADLRHQGRGDSEDARKLRVAHSALGALQAEAKGARPAAKGFAGHLADVVFTPFRWGERAARGAAEVGKMAVDATMLGVGALGRWTGAYDLGWAPISDYGQWVEATDASALDGVNHLATSFIEQWQEAIEHASHGDYARLLDITVDTALLAEGARSTAVKLKAAAPGLITKTRQLIELARRTVPRLPGHAREVVAAMAEAMDAFLAKQVAAGMQATSGPRLPGGLTPQSIAEGLDAARAKFAEARLKQEKGNAGAALKKRVGPTAVSEVEPWLERVAAALGGDGPAAERFFRGLVERVHDPAPLMQAVDRLVGAAKLAPADVQALLGELWSRTVPDPIKLLGEVRALIERPLTARAQSTLIRRAVKGQVDLEWLRRTQLTDQDLSYLGADESTSWVEFEPVSDLPSTRNPGRLADRPPTVRDLREANSKIRGIAAEMVAAEVELPYGLRIKQRQFATNSSRSGDFELFTRDGAPAELEVKSHTARAIERALVEHANGTGHQIQRLIEQVQSAKTRGRKSYVAISDAVSLESRGRLTDILKPYGLEELIFLPESEILRVGRQLRERMRMSRSYPAESRLGASEDDL